MTDYHTVKIDTETACGHYWPDFLASFRCHWSHDFDSGPEVECHFYRAHIGNLEINRTTAITVFGESNVRTMETDAARDIAENMADHLEAAE